MANVYDQPLAKEEDEDLHLRFALGVLHFGFAFRVGLHLRIASGVCI